MDFVTHAKLLLDDKVNLIDEKNMPRVDKLCEAIGRLNDETDAPAYSAGCIEEEFWVELFYSETEFGKDSLFWETIQHADKVRIESDPEEELPCYSILCYGDFPAVKIKYVLQMI